MNSTKLWKTAINPSCFGMPISGHAPRVTAATADVTATTTVVRERVAAATKGAVKGDMGLAQPYFPGTTAWRPPTC